MAYVKEVEMLGFEEQKEIRRAYLRISPEPPTLQELELKCSTFLERFGPEALSRLEGIELLTSMFHSRSRDSLCNWLELSTNQFGRLTGRFDLKFREITPSNQIDWPNLGVAKMPLDLSVEEAIDLALNIRRQLIRAMDILEDLPESGRDEVYEDLQKRLDEETPAISNLGWAHKYLSVLFPEKLTPLHSEEDQRFYLLRRFQVPPAARGLFACEGRFISLVREVALEVNLSLNQLVHSLIELHGEPYRYWQIKKSTDQESATDWDEGPRFWCMEVPISNHKIRYGDIILFVDVDEVQRISRVAHACQCCNHIEVFLLPADKWKMPDGSELPGTVTPLHNQPLTIIETEKRLRSFLREFLGENAQWGF